MRMVTTLEPNDVQVMDLSSRLAKVLGVESGTFAVVFAIPEVQEAAKAAVVDWMRQFEVGYTRT